MKDLIKHPEFHTPYDIEPEVEDVEVEVYDPLKISHDQMVYESMPEGNRAKVDRYGFNSEPAQDIMAAHEFMMNHACKLLAREVDIDARNATRDKRKESLMELNAERAEDAVELAEEVKEFMRPRLLLEGLQVNQIRYEVEEMFGVKKTRFFEIKKELMEELERG